jgi:hypothetical protein
MFTPHILVTLLQQLGDRLCNLGEVQNKPLIIARQPKKTLHLVHRCWWLPIQDIPHLATVLRDSFR